MSDLNNAANIREKTRKREKKQKKSLTPAMSTRDIS